MMVIRAFLVVLLAAWAAGPVLAAEAPSDIAPLGEAGIERAVLEADDPVLRDAMCDLPHQLVQWWAVVLWYRVREGDVTRLGVIWEVLAVVRGSGVPGLEAFTDETVLYGSGWLEVGYSHGECADGETGLYYFRNRYYSPEQGRWISRDPKGLWGDANQLGNGYGFVGANAINGLDPWGLQEGEGEGRKRDVPRNVPPDETIKIGILLGPGTTRDTVDRKSVNALSDVLNKAVEYLNPQREGEWASHWREKRLAPIIKDFMSEFERQGTATLSGYVYEFRVGPKMWGWYIRRIEITFYSDAIDFRSSFLKNDVTIFIGHANYRHGTDLEDDIGGGCNIRDLPPDSMKGKSAVFVRCYSEALAKEIEGKGGEAWGTSDKGEALVVSTYLTSIIQGLIWGLPVQWGIDDNLEYVERNQDPERGDDDNVEQLRRPGK